MLFCSMNVVLNVAAEDLYFFAEDGKRIRKGDVADYDDYIRRAGGLSNG